MYMTKIRHINQVTFLHNKFQFLFFPSLEFYIFTEINLIFFTNTIFYIFTKNLEKSFISQHRNFTLKFYRSNLKKSLGAL